jgi:hypothetical protein
MNGVRNAACCLLLALGACGAQTSSDKPSWSMAKAPLELQTQDWNPTHTELGRIVAVAEAGDGTLLFGDQGVTLVAGGAVAANDASVNHWQSAGQISAADGSGVWAVGIDADGKLYRWRAGTSLENISDRYGLLSDAVLSVAAMKGPYVAFALKDAVAVADGAHVTRFDVPTGRSLAAQAQRVAAVASDGSVRVLDAATHTLSTLALDDAGSSAFLQGQLLVQTPSALYAEHAGELTLLHRATSPLHGMVVSGERLWFVQGRELCTVDKAEIACAAADGVSGNSTLFGSVSGDVWVLTDGHLARYGLPAQGDEAVWRTNAFSVYARVCSSCHAPAGSSGIDLSTYQRWHDKRDMIYKRVIMDRTMPPDRALSDDDRKTLEAWAQPQ